MRPHELITYESELKPSTFLVHRQLKFGRRFTTPIEEIRRFKIFIENLRFVLQRVEAFARGEARFEVAMNLFGDMTAAEVSRERNGFNRTQQLVRERGFPFGSGHHLFDLQRFRIKREETAAPKRTGKKLPEEINWVEMGAVGPVLDQGKCGSCWAFSAAGALEGQHFRKTGQLVELSVQQLIDCARDNGNNGCDGGVMEEAYEYVKNSGGLAAAADYPFDEEQHECRVESNGARPVAMDTGFKRVPTSETGERVWDSKN